MKPAAAYPDLTSLRESFADRRVRTRFAPSPTGYLHPGHLLHMLYVFGLGHLLEGQVYLRLEDHDRERCRPEYEKAILQDLRTLELIPDNVQEFEQATSEYRQSDCTLRYQQALKTLRENGGRVYWCDCSRKEILARTGQEGGELRYDGYCRDRKLGPGEGRGLRLRLPDREVRFHDHACGGQSQFPARETGDLVLKDKRGNWSYMFCVVVDDLRHGTNLVIRGEDLLPSTGRQIMLAEMLAGPGPHFEYYHHPLITDETGRKLSKRHFDADIHEMLQAGAKPEQMFRDVLDRIGVELPLPPYS